MHNHEQKLQKISDKRKMTNKKDKLYKLCKIININIHPGDPQGLPDDCFYYISMNTLWRLE